MISDFGFWNGVAKSKEPSKTKMKYTKRVRAWWKKNFNSHSTFIQQNIVYGTRKSISRLDFHANVHAITIILIGRALAAPHIHSGLVHSNINCRVPWQK